MDFAKVINQGLTKASHQYTEAIQNTEFAKANLRFAPLVPALDIFTPNGFSSNFGLEISISFKTHRNTNYAFSGKKNGRRNDQT